MSMVLTADCSLLEAHFWNATIFGKPVGPGRNDGPRLKGAAPVE